MFGYHSKPTYIDLNTITSLVENISKKPEECKGIYLEQIQQVIAFTSRFYPRLSTYFENCIKSNIDRKNYVLSIFSIDKVYGIEYEDLCSHKQCLWDIIWEFIVLQKYICWNKVCNDKEKYSKEIVSHVRTRFYKAIDSLNSFIHEKNYTYNYNFGQMKNSSHSNILTNSNIAKEFEEISGASKSNIQFQFQTLANPIVFSDSVVNKFNSGIQINSADEYATSPIDLPTYPEIFSSDSISVNPVSGNPISIIMVHPSLIQSDKEMTSRSSRRRRNRKNKNKEQSTINTTIQDNTLYYRGSDVLQ